MIYFYSGTPGSGKSLHVAQDIYTQLRRGRNVIANFDINYDMVRGRNKGYFFCRDNYEITPEWLLDFALLCHKRNSAGKIIEKQTWLVIDECQLLFNCRSWNDKKRQGWSSFFSQHRKYGYNIILVSQFDRLIDRQIRSQIEYEYKHRKVNNYGVGGLIASAVFLGRPVFASVEYWYGVKEKIGVTFFFGRKKYYDLYDSYKLFEAAS